MPTTKSTAARDGYDDFVLNNAQHVHSIEGGLRSLSYILPGRFENSDIVSEALYASVGLVSLKHDSILAKEARRQNPQAPVSRFNRYTLALLKSSPLSRKVSYVLTFLQTFSVFAEMASLRLVSKQMRARIVLFIEASIAACRIALLNLSGRRMILHSQMPEREYDVTKLRPVDEISGTSWQGKRTGREHHQVSAIEGSKGFDRSMQFLLSKAMTEPAAAPIKLLSQLKGIRLLGEYAFILRPLIYVMAIKQYGISSFKPWIISLLVELFSFSTAFDLKKRTFKLSLSDLEKSEVKRRSFLFLYYLLRKPFYDSFTKSHLDAFAASISTKPVVSMLGSVIKDYQPFWENYYFYTSGSSSRG
ncbi:peroxisome membrane protein [Entophlyctis helioformis]|nr:peroxisome membrane protein [Entophlyctis helioformis]